MKNRKRRRIRITVRPYAEAVEEIIATCERIENGLPVEPQDAEINFTDAANLLSTLSEKRMELLMFLHQSGPSSIRQLAKNLGRDYSVVHGDVKTLLELGLLAKDRYDKVLVPWDELAIELPLGDGLKRAV
jgi:predicted transcriptional regulator